MRIWDLPPSRLCRQHLLGEHAELHALWSIIVNDKKGFSRHPETLRWKGKLKALYQRHQVLVREMKKRGYLHQSPLDQKKASGCPVQKERVDTIEEQVKIIRKKRCGCRV